jgi:hypothetical protein
LFDRIVIPVAVYDELSHHGTPALVRTWIAQVPPWPTKKNRPPCNFCCAAALNPCQNFGRLR